MKVISVIRFILWLSVAGSLLISCDSQRVYDKFQRLPDEGWQADSILNFNFEVNDTIRNHNLYFNVRNDRSYGFSNLWLFVRIIPPDGEILTDTVQVILANPSGKWMGKGFTGVYTSQIPYRTQVFFPASGSYTVELMHGMRSGLLKGITHAGIRLEKSSR
jgi:gliding motility-associated lipoprotein GldH